LLHQAYGNPLMRVEGPPAFPSASEDFLGDCWTKGFWGGVPQALCGAWLKSDPGVDTRVTPPSSRVALAGGRWQGSRAG